MAFRVFLSDIVVVTRKAEEGEEERLEIDADQALQSNTFPRNFFKILTNTFSDMMITAENQVQIEETGAQEAEIETETEVGNHHAIHQENLENNVVEIHRETHQESPKEILEEVIEVVILIVIDHEKVNCHFHIVQIYNFLCRKQRKR